MPKVDNNFKFLLENVTRRLSRNNLTIASAESCTGGLFSSSITDISGSSDYFILGVVAYSGFQKERLLKIPKHTLQRYSPVSKQVCRMMAQNVKKLAKAAIGIGITGYAGPFGGTAKNPKGTVYIGVSFKEKMLVKRFLFKGNRIEVKRKTVEEALRLLHDVLVNEFTS